MKEKLYKDPIIKFYLNTSKSTEFETNLPLFSETILRMAFKHVLGKLRPFDEYELQLYRKLLLFYYSEDHNSTVELLRIMICFEEDMLETLFAQEHEIMAEWSIFTRDNLHAIIFKDAFHDIVTEWAVRYIHLFGDIHVEALRMKAVEIQMFMQRDIKSMGQWLKNFQPMLSGLHYVKPTGVKNLTKKDLKIEKVFNDIEDKINPLVVKHIQNFSLFGDFSKKPVITKPKTNEVLDKQILQPFNAKNKTNEDNDDDEKEIEQSDDDSQYIDELRSAKFDKAKEESSEGIQSAPDDDDITDEESSDLTETDDSTDSDLNGSETNNNETTDVDEETPKVIDYNTAIKYISALQAFAVVNKHFESIEWLDQVDSAIRRPN